MNRLISDRNQLKNERLYVSVRGAPRGEFGGKNTSFKHRSHQGTRQALPGEVPRPQLGRPKNLHVCRSKRGLYAVSSPKAKPKKPGDLMAYNLLYEAIRGYGSFFLLLFDWQFQVL